MRTVVRSLAVALVSVGLLSSAAGCAAGQGGPTRSGSARPSAVASVSPRIPADGLSLADFGYRFGPTAELSLPRTAALSARVDQADNVTAALSAPSAAAVADYLRWALPLAGFTVTADNGTTVQPAITFTGHGWRGSFTGDDRASAVLLRPG